MIIDDKQEEFKNALLRITGHRSVDIVESNNGELIINFSDSKKTKRSHLIECFNRAKETGSAFIDGEHIICSFPAGMFVFSRSGNSYLIQDIDELLEEFGEGKNE